MRPTSIITALLLSGCASGGDRPDSQLSASTASGSDTTTGTTSDTGSTSGSGTDDGSGTSDGTTTGASTGAGSTGDTGATVGTGSTGGACPVATEGCACDVGDLCNADLVCESGTCVPGISCSTDIHEPNDTEATAKDLGSINDNDSNGSSVQGILEGMADADWFRYHGDDDFGFVADPTRTITASEGLRMCKYLECDNGLANTEVTCPAGTTPDSSGMGRPGCCKAGNFDLSDYNCAGATEDAVTVVIRIDQAAVEACVDYTLAYHF